MPKKRTLPLVCFLALLATVLAACQRTPPAPTPPPAPSAEPATPIPTITETEPAPEPATEPSEHVEDWVLPGSLGPMTTRLELEARFGKANVREETFDGQEGSGRYPVLVVFPDDPRKRLELVQDADNPDAPIIELRLSDPATQWHASNGLRPGMSLAELVKLNGAPVSFYGVGWDYGGVVQDWRGGKLANAVDSNVFHRVVMTARNGIGDTRLPQGDTSFRSDDTRYPTLGEDLVVGEVGISWPHEGED